MSTWSKLAPWQKMLALGAAGYTLSECYARFMESDLTGEIIVITGAASGIGRLLSLHLAKMGCRLILWDINASALEAVEQEIKIAGGEAKAYVVDITQRSAIYETQTQVETEFGQVDILINNAGIVTGKSFLNCPDSLMEKTMQVNTLAHFWTLKAFLPGMLARNHGQIVTIASMAGICASAGLVDYCASKYAAVGLAESLGMELRRLGKTGVSSVCVCPFYIKTGMFEGARSRFEWLLPIMEPEYATKRIILAMKRKTPMLIMPWFCTTAPLLKGILPVSVAMAVTDFLGMNNAMDEFVQTRQN